MERILLPALDRVPASPIGGKPPRRYYLDWLRVIAVSLLLIYHANLIFEPDMWWMIKSDEVSPLIGQFDYMVSQWRLPLLFLVSGVSTNYMLGSRSGRVYVYERVKRLIIPLVAATLLLLPLQAYFATLHQAVKAGATPLISLGEFLPMHFGVMLTEKKIPLEHLWFLAYLFIYSVLALPLFLGIRRFNQQPQLGWMHAILASRFSILLMSIPMVLLQVVVLFVLPEVPGVPQRIVEYLGEHIVRYGYFLFFVYGFIIATNDNLNQTMLRQRHVSLGLAISAFTAHALFAPFSHGLLAVVVMSVNAWLWVVAILGYAQIFLSRPNALLRYATELVAPFYIIHMPVLFMVSFFVLQWTAPLPLKLAAIILGTFSLTALFCELVRRNDVSRFLFGMNSLAKARARRQERADTQSVSQA